MQITIDITLGLWTLVSGIVGLLIVPVYSMWILTKVLYRLRFSVSVNNRHEAFDVFTADIILNRPYTLVPSAIKLTVVFVLLGVLIDSLL